MKQIIVRVALMVNSLAGAMWLSGCDQIGPGSIDLGRANYNDAIHRTAAVQLLSNIVRVHDQEMPLVMDVTEVDAALVAESSLTGGITGIAARAMTAGGTLIGMGSASTSVIYEESPTIRYAPLSGQPLIAQLSRPIDVGSLVFLDDAGWPSASVLAFTVVYATANQDDTNYALNAINDLTAEDALKAATIKSDLTSQSPDRSGGQTRSSDGSNAGTDSGNQNSAAQNVAASSDDSIVFYFDPKHSKAKSSVDKERMLRLWVRLLELYAGTQPTTLDASMQQLSTVTSAANKALIQSQIAKTEKYQRDQVAKLSEMLKTIQTVKEPQLGWYLEKANLPNWIELRTVPLSPKINQTCATAKGDCYRCAAPLDESKNLTQACDLAPLMHLNSALGVLKNANDRQNPLIEFVRPDVFNKIRGQQQKDPEQQEKWNTGDLWKGIPDFYTLLPGDRDSTCISSFGNVPQMQSSGDCPAHDPSKDEFITSYIKHATKDDLYVVLPDGRDRNYELDDVLASFRRYVLIIESTNRPDVDFPGESAFATYSRAGKYYYVLDDDEVSKQNLSLLANILSIMAIPSQGQGLTSSISVNAK